PTLSTAAPRTPGPRPTKTSAPPTRRPTPRPVVVPAAGGRNGALARLGVRRATGTAAVALTFDDGPHPVHTPEILAVLRAHRVKATFCVVGTQVRRHPGLVRQIAREGHTLCNHSWNHEFTLGRKSEAEIQANLLRTNREIRRAVPGARVPYFRHPGGNWTAAAVRVAHRLGMLSIDWTVDPQDWNKPTAAQITSRVLGSTRAGGIVLLHDGGGVRSATVTACRRFIPALKRKHRLVRLP
ncbi:MAG TPA: polysaccharide deacetylase family protein, partial [Pilimelia sp.]|nr:polysaccharide deacetylase family protein [Pilimelia sp.]